MRRPSRFQSKRSLVAGLLAVALGLQPPAAVLAAGLGTARGARGAEMSLDGSRWLSLERRALPAMPGSLLRTSTGTIQIDLADGSRITVAPFSSGRVEPSGTVALAYGRADLRFVPKSQAAVTAGSAALSPGDAGAAADLLVERGGATAVRVRAGSVQVRSADGSTRVARAGEAPVVLGEPRTQAALFDRPAIDRGSRRTAFGAKGESLGYLTPDGTLVAQAGFARDLRGPFDSRTVAQAVARIPEDARRDALPVFDVDGGYLGYIEGHAFYAFAGPMAQAAPAAAAGQSGGQAVDADWRWDYTLGILVVAGGIAAVAIAADDDKPASPTGP